MVADDTAGAPPQSDVERWWAGLQASDAAWARLDVDSEIYRLGAMWYRLEQSGWELQARESALANSYIKTTELALRESGRGLVTRPQVEEYLSARPSLWSLAFLPVALILSPVIFVQEQLNRIPIRIVGFGRLGDVALMVAIFWIGATLLGVTF